MCKIVYLTSKSFDTPSTRFRNLLKDELKERGVEVVTDTTLSIKRWIFPRRIYGIAIAIDFTRDETCGSSLTLNKYCPNLVRDFAYSISNSMDKVMPSVRWRDFKFVDSDDAEWKKYFRNINAYVKALFYLCNCKKELEYDIFSEAEVKIVRAFADEIVRCLRSNYNYEDYKKRVKMQKLKRQRRDGLVK